MKANMKEAPKLPRFIVPKSMKSVKFRSKKDKSCSRQALNRISCEDFI